MVRCRADDLAAVHDRDGERARGIPRDAARDHSRRWFGARTDGGRGRQSGLPCAAQGGGARDRSRDRAEHELQCERAADSQYTARGSRDFPRHRNRLPVYRRPSCGSSMTATDRDRLIEWNRTEVAFESDKCIHDLFEAQALRTPEKTAVIYRDKALTYRALWEKVRRLATHLRALGVKPETIVAIMMDRSLDMMVAMLAVLKAGGAYLPLDPAFPAERVALMLKDSDARVILSQSSYKDRLEMSSATVIAVDEFEFDSEGTDSAQAAATDQDASSLAYLIYTSGSTGTPKGVMVEHRNVVNFFAAMDRVVGTEAGVWLAVTSISFDISVLELFWTLSRGFTVGLQSGRNGLAATGDYSIQAQILQHRVTHFQCTPTLARSLIRFPEMLSSMMLLEKLFLGGEALPVSLANELGEALSADIINMYGPTETTVWSTTHKAARSSASVRIGR